MPKTKQHKANTRELIVQGAGRLFRRDGVAQASVGGVMAEAGLTHGGFYAHFDSKQALLAEVMRNDHGFIRLLARRSPGTATHWRQQTARVFADYLNPAHLSEVALGCSFAALTGDAARADADVRAAYREAWTQLVGELLRAPQESAPAAFERATVARREAAAALAALAIGAVAIARVLAPEPAAAALLNATARQAELAVKALARER